MTNTTNEKTTATKLRPGVYRYRGYRIVRTTAACKGVPLYWRVGINQGLHVTLSDAMACVDRTLDKVSK